MSHRQTLPPDWAPQAAVMLTWPRQDGDFARHFDAVERNFIAIAVAIGRFQNLHVNVAEAADALQARLISAGVPRERLIVHEVPNDDVWARDHGPITVVRDGRLVHLDFTFNGWGGKFARIWDGRKTIFTRLTTTADQAEVFGVVEFALPVPAGMTRAHTVRVMFDGRIPAPVVNDGRVLRFRFAPRDAKVWPYVIRSDFPGLEGKSGAFTAVPPPVERTSRASATHPNWWIDDPDPAAAEGVHPGARSVNRWREDFLRDFAARMERCKSPKP